VCRLTREDIKVICRHAFLRAGNCLRRQNFGNDTDFPVEKLLPSTCVDLLNWCPDRRVLAPALDDF